MVNIVGDHATYHRRYERAADGPDIETAAKPFLSRWVKTSPDAKSVAADGAGGDRRGADAAGARSRTLILLPADTAWNEGSGPGRSAPCGAARTGVVRGSR